MKVTLANVAVPQVTFFPHDAYGPPHLAFFMAWKWWPMESMCRSALLVIFVGLIADGENLEDPHFLHCAMTLVAAGLAGNALGVIVGLAVVG